MNSVMHQGQHGSFSFMVIFGCCDLCPRRCVSTHCYLDHCCSTKVFLTEVLKKLNAMAPPVRREEYTCVRWIDLCDSEYAVRKYSLS